MDERLGLISCNGISFLEWVNIRDYQIPRFANEIQSEVKK